jgi:hypothetical protein
MAIKKLTFSFEVPITQLLGLIATGNSGLKIDVVGDDRPHPMAKLLNGAHPAMKLLEGPKHGNTGKSRARGQDANGHAKTGYQAMLEAMAKAPDYAMPIDKLRPIVAALGLTPSTASSQVSLMRQRGHARRISDGIYGLTANGIHECERRNIPVIGKSRKAKAKKKAVPKKPAAKKPAPVEPVAAEQDHG